MDFISHSVLQRYGFTSTVKMHTDDIHGLRHSKPAFYQTIANQLYVSLETEIQKALSQWFAQKDKHTATPMTQVYVTGETELQYYSIIVHVLCSPSTCLGDITHPKLHRLCSHDSIHILRDAHHNWCKLNMMMKHSYKIKKQNIEIAQEDCSICLQPLIHKCGEWYVRLPTCSHLFCEGCIQDWMIEYNHDTCPTCRCECDIF